MQYTVVGNIFEVALTRFRARHACLLGVNF
jgi:hypothetical protein